MNVRRFLQSFPLPIIGVDRERRVALWNAAAERFFGWSAAEVLGKPDPSVPADVAAEHKTLWDAAFRGDAAVQRESTRVTRDGVLLDVTITAVAVTPDDDEVLAVMLVCDMTQQRGEEERLAERESQLRLMLEQMPAIISTFDTDIVFTSAEGAGLRALGLGPADFVGRRLPDIMGEDAAPVRSVRAALNGESSVNEFEFRGRWYENRAEPLRHRDGTVAGVINLGFDVTDRRRTEEALRDSREQLRRLSAAMNRIQEDERRRIARELHDELGQLLTSLRLDLGVMRRNLHRDGPPRMEEKIAAMFDLVELTIQTVRRVAWELRPTVLDDFGLRAALENEIAAFAERTAIDVRLSMSHEELIDADRATALYRVALEALTNVARHAGATRVDVRIDVIDDHVELEVRDNGRGITETEANGGTLGLLGARERVWALGGEIVIEGVPGNGTRVFASIPR